MSWWQISRRQTISAHHPNLTRYCRWFWIMYPDQWTCTPKSIMSNSVIITLPVDSLAALMRACGYEALVWAYREITLRWRHNGRDSVSNHQPHDCLLNRLFRRRSKNTSKLRVTGFVLGIHRWPVNSPHKGPVTRKMFPFDDMIMNLRISVRNWQLKC